MNERMNERMEENLILKGVKEANLSMNKFRRGKNYAQPIYQFSEKGKRKIIISLWQNVNSNLKRTKWKFVNQNLTLNHFYHRRTRPSSQRRSCRLGSGPCRLKVGSPRVRRWRPHHRLRGRVQGALQLLVGSLLPDAHRRYSSERH